MQVGVFPLLRGGWHLVSRDNYGFRCTATQDRFPRLSKILQLCLVVLKLNAVLQEKGTNVQHRLVNRQIASASHVSRYFCHICKAATPALPTQSQRRRSESRAEVWAFLSYLTRREMKPKPKTFASTQYGAAGRVRARTCTHIFNIHNHMPFAAHLLCTEVLTQWFWLTE